MIISDLTVYLCVGWQQREGRRGELDHPTNLRIAKRPAGQSDVRLLERARRGQTGQTAAGANRLLGHRRVRRHSPLRLGTQRKGLKF
jgi:hypothetical protein